VISSIGRLGEMTLRSSGREGRAAGRDQCGRRGAGLLVVRSYSRSRWHPRGGFRTQRERDRTSAAKAVKTKNGDGEPRRVMNLPSREWRRGILAFPCASVQSGGEHSEVAYRSQSASTAKARYDALPSRGGAAVLFSTHRRDRGPLQGATRTFEPHATTIDYVVAALRVDWSGPAALDRSS